MVLVPGGAGTPLPQVRRLETERGVGAEIVWNGAADQVLFGSGEAMRAGGTESDGCAAFVRRAGGRVTEWALLDGTRLAADGAELVKRPSRAVAESAAPRANGL
jgi:hypothetical protein